jgi:4-amino-4-deoxy-L-arabinose transferase-like glycosyltransferase
MVGLSSLKEIRFLKNISFKQKLFLLLAAGFLVRLYVVLNAVTISVDSIVYLNLAQEISSGNFYGGMSLSRPPLYPMLISFFSFLFSDQELAGRLVSLIFGTLVIPVSFYLGRFIYNEKVGFITAFFVAVHPYLVRYSGDVLTEALYHFLVVTVTILGLKALFSRNIALMLLVGFFSFLAYLTKQSGIGFLLMLSFLVVFYNFGEMRTDWEKRIRLLVSAWSVFILLALPYIFYLYQETGLITVTGRTEFTPEGFDTAKKLITFLKHFWEAFTIPFSIFFLWGVFKRFRGGFSRYEYGLIAILVAYWLMYLSLHPARRYLIQLMPIALVFPAMGFCYVEEWLKERIKGKAPVIIVVLLLLLTAVQLSKGLVSLKAHHLPEKLAGLWLMEHEGKGTTIMTRKPIVVFYAKGNYVRLWDGNLKDVIEYGRKRGVQYIAGYIHRLREKIPDFDKEKILLLKKVASFRGQKGEDFVIYKLSPT